MSWFSGLSVDKSSNYLDTLNESTQKQVKEKNVNCAANIEQYLANEINVGGSVGGSIDVQNVAGLMSKCVQESKDQEELLENIANDVAQKHTTDKGGAGLVSMASINLQDNKTTVKNILKKEYQDILNVNCDTSIVQKQANKINIGGNVGGNITSKNVATLSSECQQVASLNRRVATELANNFSQSTETKVPLGIFAIIALVIIIIIIGVVLYYTLGSDAPKRRAGMMANFPGYGEPWQQQQMQQQAMQLQQMQQQQQAPLQAPVGVAPPQGPVVVAPFPGQYQQ